MRAACRIVERGSIGYENIVIAIAIVVKNGGAVTGGLENVFFVRASAVGVGDCKAGCRRDIDEVDRDRVEGGDSGQKPKCDCPASDP